LDLPADVDASTVSSGPGGELSLDVPLGTVVGAGVLVVGGIGTVVVEVLVVAGGAQGSTCSGHAPNDESRREAQPRLVPDSDGVNQRGGLLRARPRCDGELARQAIDDRPRAPSDATIDGEAMETLDVVYPPSGVLPEHSVAGETATEAMEDDRLQVQDLVAE
jgi:hypothetical protein